MGEERRRRKKDEGEREKGGIFRMTKKGSEYGGITPRGAGRRVNGELIKGASAVGESFLGGLILGLGGE